MKLVVIGNSCVGKSTLIKNLSNVLDLPVFDVDRWTADQYKYNAKFRHQLKSEFRSDEKHKIIELIKRDRRCLPKIMSYLEEPFNNAITHFLSTHDRCIIDMAQALESPNFEELFGDMIVINVHASTDDRIIMAGMRGVPEEKLKMYDQNQYSPWMKKLLADYTIVNRPYVHGADSDLIAILHDMERVYRLYAQTHKSDWVFENPSEVNEIKHLFFKVVKQYHTNNMAYHNMEHIFSMLKLARGVGAIDRILFMAILMHDMIYDPRSSTNEEDSAIAAMELLQQHTGFTLTTRQSVAELIMTTKHGHTVAGYRSLASQYLVNTIVDLDLAIFFAPKEAVLEYDRAIKVEYAGVFPSWVEGLQKRIQILKMFRDRATIYHHRYDSKDRTTLDEIAKENLQMLIDLNQKELDSYADTPSETDGRE